MQIVCEEIISAYSCRTHQPSFAKGEIIAFSKAILFKKIHIAAWKIIKKSLQITDLVVYTVIFNYFLTYLAKPYTVEDSWKGD